MEATHITTKLYSSIIDLTSVFVVRAQARGLAAGGSVLVAREPEPGSPAAGGSVLVAGAWEPEPTRSACWRVCTGGPGLGTRANAVWLLEGL